MPEVEINSVCHVVRRFVKEKWGGTEAVVLNYSVNLIRQGVKCSIFATNIFTGSKKETIEGAQVRRFKYIFPWLFLSKDSKEKLKLKGGSPLSISLFIKLLFKKDLSIIHTHVQHRLGGIARTVAKIRNIPYVVSLHGNYLTLPKEESTKMMAPFKGKLEWGKAFGFLFGARKTVKDADAVICVDLGEFEQMTEKYPENKIIYMPNGVEIEKFKDADQTLFRESIGLKSDEKYILCLSRIDYQKNQRLLVESFAEYSQKHPNHKLVLIGPITVEQYHTQILEDIKSKGLQDKVIIIPGLDYDDPKIPAAYKGADFFVLPSKHEPFGIVILEAWAAGTPVIASDLSGIRAFTKHQQNILHFKSNSSKNLLDQMNELDNSELREKLTQNAQSEVNNYSWSAITSQLKSLYQELIYNKRKKS
jgi:glycosyltransferase involved in cell wall biosynthesis